MRERRKVTLREGLRRMTLIPAQILEGGAQMKRKGRLQVGADADLIAFDLATVSERGTYAQLNRTAAVMRYVLLFGAQNLLQFQPKRIERSCFLTLLF